MYMIPEFPPNSEDTLSDLLKGFVVMSFILSGAGCLWRRRRRRQSNHSDRHERREDSSLRRAIAIAIEQRNRETHAGNRNVVQSPYRVPRAAPVDGKLDDVVIDMAEISIDDIELMKESKESVFHLKNKWLEQQLRLKHKYSKTFVFRAHAQYCFARADAKSVKLEVDRNDLFYDSFRLFAKLSGEQLQGPLQVKFKREDGRDDGGLTRHWFMLISREVNSASKHQSHHLDYFRFIGRVWGKAIFDDNDIEATDLDLYFVIEEEEFGSIVQVPLKELLCERRLVKSVQPQLDSLKAGVLCIALAGFYDIMPHDVLLKFTEDELELLLCGMPTIDIADWKENCEYKVLRGTCVLERLIQGLSQAGYTADHEVMLWFWELVESWDEVLLQGPAGCQLEALAVRAAVAPDDSALMDNFKGLYGATGPKKFQIIRVYDTTRLPQSTRVSSMYNILENIHTFAALKSHSHCHRPREVSMT
eukprot:759906-Hanusia_phi.AAC.3